MFLLEVKHSNLYIDELEKDDSDISPIHHLIDININFKGERLFKLNKTKTFWFLDHSRENSNTFTIL